MWFSLPFNLVMILEKVIESSSVKRVHQIVHKRELHITCLKFALLLWVSVILLQPLYKGSNITRMLKRVRWFQASCMLILGAIA